MRTRKLPTIYDISEKTGVSYSSVAKILRGRPGFKPATCDRVRNAADSLGYRPNLLSRAISSSRNMTIGIVACTHGSVISHDRIRSMERAAGSKGYHCYIAHIDSDELSTFSGHVLNFIDRRVDGIIVYSSAKATEVLFTIPDPYDVPHVFVDSAPEKARNKVLIDRGAGTREVADHLLELGHKRVGLLVGQWKADEEDPKKRAYEECLRQVGIHVVWEKAWITSTGSTGQSVSINASAAYDTVKAAIKHDKDIPTAIIASNDCGALAALAAIHDLGMKVPEDFAVVGFDDNEFAGLTRPTLTSVQQPGEIVGQKSVELLLRQINDPARPIEPLVFPCKLIVRESTI